MDIDILGKNTHAKWDLWGLADGSRSYGSEVVNGDIRLTNGSTFAG